MGIYKLYKCFRGQERLEELGDICCNELGNCMIHKIKKFREYNRVNDALKFTNFLLSVSGDA